MIIVKQQICNLSAVSIQSDDLEPSSLLYPFLCQTENIKDCHLW